MTQISGLVATLRNGFTGMPFTEWLHNFCYELSLSPGFAVQIDCRALPSGIQKTVIPMCAPAVSSPWNTTLSEYLIGNGAHIGILHGIPGNASRDFYISELQSGAEIVSGECKCYQHGVPAGVVKSALGKLDSEFSTPINILVVNTLQSDPMPHSYANLEYSLYALVRSGYAYSIRHMPGSKNDSDRVFIVIDQSILQ